MMISGANVRDVEPRGYFGLASGNFGGSLLDIARITPISA
jgi:hypothetical protein